MIGIDFFEIEFCLIRRALVLYLVLGYLRMKDSKVVKATALHIGFEVVKPVILLNLLTMFGVSSFFSSFFGCGSHVVEPREETTQLGCDD